MSWNDEEEFLRAHLVGVVLNLKSSPERYKNFMCRACQLPFGITRLEAKDGKNLSEDFKDLLVDERVYGRHYGGKFPSSGTIGCYLSHRLAWKKMVQHAIPWMLVFEDDVKFCPNLLSRILYELLTRYKDSIDICNFSLRGAGMPLKVGEVLTHHLCVYGRDVYCAGAYLLNLKSAKQLFKYSFPMQFQIDDYYTQTWRWNLVFTGVEPRIACHDDHVLSDIKERGGRQFRKICYSSKLVHTFVYGGLACLSIVLREYLNMRRLIVALKRYAKVRIFSKKNFICDLGKIY
ncbi:putative inactive glycosyltransferase 25 family member 3 [Holospora elegans E1]|uniref:Putative inactive glycosyltransferase 25 family member 3 n=1 Tax=Holospora elegans E1 TaxID=1427503 RepID=A0A023DZB7_9PROT|nr:glycosyltransferase family 25 protein [Holospora elegans]GAJ46222.1 putative inactive glycosyltransferase 25 family member 3 [Holospora elegans E1]